MEDNLNTQYKKILKLLNKVGNTDQVITIVANLLINIGEYLEGKNHTNEEVISILNNFKDTKTLTKGKFLLALGHQILIFQERK